MVVTYVIDVDAGIVTATAIGPTSSQDVADYQNRVKRDPLFRPSFHQIFDFSAAMPTDIFGAQIESLLYSSPLSPTSRRAFVVSPGVVYGLARQTETMSEGRLSVRLFEDVASARQWVLQP